MQATVSAGMSRQDRRRCFFGAPNDPQSLRHSQLRASCQGYSRINHQAGRWEVWLEMNSGQYELCVATLYEHPDCTESERNLRGKCWVELNAFMP